MLLGSFCSGLEREVSDLFLLPLDIVWVSRTRTWTSGGRPPNTPSPTRWVRVMDFHCSLPAVALQRVRKCEDDDHGTLRRVGFPRVETRRIRAARTAGSVQGDVTMACSDGDLYAHVTNAQSEGIPPVRRKLPRWIEIGEGQDGGCWRPPGWIRCCSSALAGVLC